MPLLGISPILSPDLLDALNKMGHGDEIVFADAHFPGESIAARGRGAIRLVRADGLSVATLLAALLPLFPLDTFANTPPLAMMQKVDDDTTDVAPTIAAFQKAIAQGCAGKPVAVDMPSPQIEFVERFKFYERAAGAAVIVQTGEVAKYGNIILRKGVCYWTWK